MNAIAEVAALFDAQSKPDPAGGGAVAEALADRVLRGEPAAFDELVTLYQARISRLVYRLTGWSSDSEDVVQEVFLAALTQGHRFRREASLATWLTTIALNKCRSRQRSLGIVLKRFLSRPLDDADHPAAGSSSDGGLIGRETAEGVRKAVRALAPRDREVVVLRYFEDLSLPEIAAITSQSRNAVEVRLHRARARLAMMLRDVAQED